MPQTGVRRQRTISCQTVRACIGSDGKNNRKSCRVTFLDMLGDAARHNRSMLCVGWTRPTRFPGRWRRQPDLRLLRRHRRATADLVIAFKPQIACAPRRRPVRTSRWGTCAASRACRSSWTPSAATSAPHRRAIYAVRPSTLRRRCRDAVALRWLRLRWRRISGNETRSCCATSNPSGDDLQAQPCVPSGNRCCTSTLRLAQGPLEPERPAPGWWWATYRPDSARSCARAAAADSRRRGAGAATRPPPSTGQLACRRADRGQFVAPSCTRRQGTICPRGTARALKTRATLRTARA